MDHGDAALVETYSAALIALDEEFRALKQSCESDVSFRDIIDIVRSP